MTIAYNGVNLTDYDPLGMGAIVMAGLRGTATPASISAGETVDGGTIRLAGMFDDQSASSGVARFGSYLPIGTTWMCLGHANREAVTSAFSVTLWMRVQ